MPENDVGNVVNLAGVSVEDNNLVTNEDGSQTLTLTVMVMDGKDEVTSLIFHRPMASDLAAMDESKGEVGKTIRAISRVTHLPVKVIEKLDAYDFLQAGAVLSGFLTRPR